MQLVDALEEYYLWLHLAGTILDTAKVSRMASALWRGVPPSSGEGQRAATISASS